MWGGRARSRWRVSPETHGRVVAGIHQSAPRIEPRSAVLIRSPNCSGTSTNSIGAPGFISLRSMVSRVSRQPYDFSICRSTRTSGSNPGAKSLRDFDQLIGAPGFEPGTSASRTQRSTGLSHAPVLRTTHFNWWANEDGVGWTSLRSCRTHSAIFFKDRVGSKPTFNLSTQEVRTGWDSNPRGCKPTRFPIVRLKPLGHPSKVGPPSCSEWRQIHAFPDDGSQNRLCPKR